MAFKLLPVLWSAVIRVDQRQREIIFRLLLKPFGAIYWGYGEETSHRAVIV